MFLNFIFSVHEFFFHLFNVHFSEPLGYYMMYFVDVYFAAFYYLTLVVIFVFWSTFAIVWQFYYKQVISPSAIDIEMRDELIKFSHVTHNETLEFWWTIIPSIIIFFVALPALLLLYAIESPLAEPVMTVKVVGHQWYWSYEYTDKLDKSIYGSFADKSVMIDSYRVPDAELTIGQKRLLQVDKPIVLPIETQIRVVVTAADVLHSWALPSLGVKMDAVPGRLNQFYLYIPMQGVYYGQCSELCGVEHGFMPIALYAVKPEIFVDWYLRNAS